MQLWYRADNWDTEQENPEASKFQEMMKYTGTEQLCAHT